MTGGVTATQVLAATAAGTLVSSVINGQQQAKAQKNAASQAEQAAKKQADQADQAMNKANAKRPNPAAMMAANQTATQGGTMLTGPGGIDLTALELGKKTLLGQ